MIMSVYNGNTLWRCFETLIKGNLIIGDLKNALICIDYFYDRFGGIDCKNKDVMNVAFNAAIMCVSYCNQMDGIDISTELLLQLGQSRNKDVNSCVNMVKTVYGGMESYEFERLLDFTIKYKYPKEFFDLLWLSKDDITSEELRNKWVEYVQDCEAGDIRPWNYIKDYEKEYSKSILKFYVDLEKNTDSLLEYYFSREKIYHVEKEIIRNWIYDGDWERFTKYIAQIVNITSKDYFYSSDIRRELQKYMNATFFRGDKDNIDMFGRSDKELMKERSNDFSKALAKISFLTIDCDAHNNFHEFIKYYIQKQSGSLKIIHSFGFDDEMDTRSAETRLKEYVHRFLQGGGVVHESELTTYCLIEEALYEELHGPRGGNSYRIVFDFDSAIIELKKKLKKNTRDYTNDSLFNDEDKKHTNKKKIDKNLERNYRFALDDEIAEFYFQHFPQEFIKRKDFISACIRKGNNRRAIELIDMMIENKKKANYEERNGWGHFDMCTIEFLIDEYRYKTDDQLFSNKDITNEMRKVVKQLVSRILPHLPKKAIMELKEKNLYKLDFN